jgi:hypothetical protein
MQTLGRGVPPERLAGAHHTNPIQILAPRPPRRAPKRSLSRHAVRPPSRQANPRKAATVRMRLHGTAEEIAATLAALGRVLDITEISRPYPDRSPVRMR